MGVYYKYEYVFYLKMKQGVIYLIINKVNGHKYIGQTTQGMNKRWKQHIDEALRLSDKPLHCAMRKHGNHNFMIREICECNENELDEKEEYYIKEYNTTNIEIGYNHMQIEKPVLVESKPKQKTGFQLAKNRSDGKHLANKILSVNVETGKETEWNSITEASIALTGDKKNNGNIVRAMNKGYKCYGHLWKRLEKSNQCIKVYGVHKITWIKTPIYNSIKEAGRIYGTESGVRKSLKNPRRNSYKGYYWFRV